MTDPLSAEAVYLRLGGLSPTHRTSKPIPDTDTHRWVARVLALIEMGNLVDTGIISFKVASQSLQGVLREMNAGTILAIAHQALAKAELQAPAELQGAFIAAGHTFDAFAAVGKALGTATADVLSWTRMPTRRC